MALNLTAPFKRGGAFPIDEDLVKSKAEMKATNDNTMPDKYFCVCSDDGQIYLYDKSNSIDAETGRYRVFEGGSDDKFFEYTQSTPSQEWEIAHTLKKFPAVTVVDSAGSVVVGDITYIDDSNITITFQAAFAGKAFLN